MFNVLFRRKFSVIAGLFAARYAYKMWQQNPEFQKKVRDALPKNLDDLKNALPSSIADAIPGSRTATASSANLKSTIGQVGQRGQAAHH